MATKNADGSVTEETTQEPAERIEPPIASPEKRKHRATYATDKRSGGYLVRVTGPTADAFAGRLVPVIRKDGSESLERLERLIWSGPDKETGAPVALYRFQPRPREEVQTEF